MIDFISASPLLVLGVLAALSWLVGGRGLKLLTVAAFFGLPVIVGNVQFQPDWQFLKDVINFWVNEAVESLANYLKEKLMSF